MYSSSSILFSCCLKKAFAFLFRTVKGFGIEECDNYIVANLI